DGARAQGILHLALHRGHIRVRAAAGEGALAHHISAQRRVADVAAVGDSFRKFVDDIEKLRVGLPLPFYSRQHSVAADVLGALQVAKHKIRLALAARREREAAVAEYHGRDAVIAGTAAKRIPKNLRI